jgi:hypothetical protein
MKQRDTAGGEAQQKAQHGSKVAEARGLDAQYAELIETVWACEQTWKQDDHVDTAIKYGR